MMMVVEMPWHDPTGFRLRRVMMMIVIMVMFKNINTIYNCRCQRNDRKLQ